MNCSNGKRANGSAETDLPLLGFCFVTELRFIDESIAYSEHENQKSCNFVSAPTLAASSSSFRHWETYIILEV